MHFFLKAVLLGSALVTVARADETGAVPPWQTRAIGVESGVLWEIGSGTNISYRLIHTQISWRSKEAFGWGLSDGSRLLVRHRLTLIGDIVDNGPESHYIAVSGSPSVEWWDKTGRWSLFTGSGGGFGVIDSRGVKGGMGQDLTLNWFIRGGLEHVTAKNFRLNAGIMYQHMSNSGMTKPNPGIDALGFLLGCSWSH